MNRGIWMQGCRASFRRDRVDRMVRRRSIGGLRRTESGRRATGWALDGGDSTAVEGAGGGGIAVRKAGVRHARTGREVVVSGADIGAKRAASWTGRAVCSGGFGRMLWEGLAEKTSKYSHLWRSYRSIHSVQQQCGVRRRRKCPQGHAISAKGAHPRHAAWGVRPKAAPGGRDGQVC